MFFRKHLSISEIARRTTLTRNTIKKWLKAADGSEPKYRRPPKLTKLTPFEPKILMALVADAHRPKRDRRNALMLFKEIKQDGFTGSYTRVTTFGLYLENAITYRDREPFVVGPFRITPFLTDHSAFDAYSLLIEAEGRKVFYTGDFRGHGRKQAVFNRLLTEPTIKGVDVMLMDGTHLGKESHTNSQTEYSLEDDITESISNTTGLVLASFSAQNIDRFVTFWKAARRAGRTFVADAYLAHILEALNRPSFPKPPVFLPARMKMKLVRENNTSIVIPFRRRRIYPEQIPDRANKLVMMFRPSMMDEFEGLQCLAGGKLIYSQWPGYIEKDSVNIKDWCSMLNVSFEIQHTSGHADVKTLMAKPEASLKSSSYYQLNLCFSSVS